MILSDHPPVMTKVMERLFDLRFMEGPLNLFYHKMMSTNELVRWNLLHGMYAYDAKSPSEYVRKIRRFTLRGIGDKIEQDVLVIGAKKIILSIPGSSTKNMIC